MVRLVSNPTQTQGHGQQNTSLSHTRAYHIRRYASSLYTYALRALLPPLPHVSTIAHRFPFLFSFPFPFTFKNCYYVFVNYYFIYFNQGYICQYISYIIQLPCSLVVGFEFSTLTVAIHALLPIFSVLSLRPSLSTSRLFEFSDQAPILVSLLSFVSSGFIFSGSVSSSVMV